MPNEGHPHSIQFNNSVKKKAERIAALLELNEWFLSFGLGINLALDHAENYVKGDTEVIYCSKKIANFLENNEKFVDALCEEGVVEWLTPLVMTKLNRDRLDK